MVNKRLIGWYFHSNKFIPEVQAVFVDRSFVTMLYFGFLRRDAEAGGFAFWMQKLSNSNHDFRQLEDSQTPEADLAVNSISFALRLYELLDAARKMRRTTSVICNRARFHPVRFSLTNSCIAIPIENILDPITMRVKLQAHRSFTQNLSLSIIGDA